MNTNLMTKEEYENVIYSKEEIEREYEAFRQSKHEYITPKQQIDYAIENNHYVYTINNYDILKKYKSEILVDISKYIEWRDRQCLK